MHQPQQPSSLPESTLAMDALESCCSPPDGDSSSKGVTLSGEHLSIADVVRVARYGAPVRVTEDERILLRIQASCDCIATSLQAEKRIYGVTTGFGAMAGVPIEPRQASELQQNLIWFLRTGAGRRLPAESVRAAMLLRANSHLRGVSGVRFELIRRLIIFLNERVTPHVHEFGSIGASGDLVPLASITGALIGLDPGFSVDFDGAEMGSPEALQRLGLPPLRLGPKEGLAMVNGTSVMTGIAANCVHDARTLLALSLGAHALLIQGLGGTDESFHPFIHAHKPHSGQVWTAARMRDLLAGSQLTRSLLDPAGSSFRDGLSQDRYSLRCLAQYMGPIVEGLAQIHRQIEVEINSTTDNPLIDAEQQVAYQGGNFLGQYVGVGMDQLRFYLGLLSKHLDIQVALLVAPEFNNGLTPSLVGNASRNVNMGLKGLQLTGNSLMPLITFFGNSLIDRFPTHAEQFNQNINSQGFGAANLARQSIGLFQQYMAVALMFGVQAADLRTYKVAGHYHTPDCLSPLTSRLYLAVREVMGSPPSAARPYVWDDDEQALDIHIVRIGADIAAEGRIPCAVNDLLLKLPQG